MTALIICLCAVAYLAAIWFIQDWLESIGLPGPAAMIVSWLLVSAASYGVFRLVYG
jgi:hypothetical protein